MRCRNCGTLHLEPTDKCTVCFARFHHTKLRGRRNHQKEMKQKARKVTEDQLEEYFRIAKRDRVPVRTPREFDNYIPGKDEPTVKRR